MQANLRHLGGHKKASGLDLMNREKDLATDHEGLQNQMA